MPQSLRSLANQPPPLPRFLSPGLLPEGGRFIIGGRSKVGKSYLALELATALARGVPFLNIFPMKPVTMLMVQAEMPKGAFFHVRLKPIIDLCKSNGALDRFFLEQTTDLRLENTTDVTRMIDMVVSCQASVLLVDPLYVLHTGSFNDAGSVKVSLDALNYIGEKTGVCLGLVAHFRKSFITSSGKKVEQDFEDILGSNLFTGWPDTIITVTPLKEDIMDSVFSKRRISMWTRWLPEMGSISAELRPTPPFYTVSEASWKLKVMGELGSGKSTTVSAISKRTATNYESVKRFLEMLEQVHIIHQQGKGEYVIS